MTALREFRRPLLWLVLWLTAIAAVIVLSLLAPPKMSVPHGFDKFEHGLAYAALSAYAVMLFARWRTQVLVGIGLVLLGIGLEFAQATLTTTRAGDWQDALANTLGVLLGLLLAKARVATLLQRIDRRLP